MPARPIVPIAPPADLSPVRIKVSYRWLTGTLLNGVIGIVLMGGALYAAIDGQSKFAVEPVMALASQVSDTPEDRKSDKYADTASQAVRLIILESNTRQVGEKEFIEIKRYARVAAQLSLTETELTANMPPFDPLKLFSEAAEAEENNQPLDNAPASHGIINVSLVDMTEGAPSVDTTLLIDNVQARNMVREALELSGSIARYSPSVAENDDGFFGSDASIQANFVTWNIGDTASQEQFANFSSVERSATEQQIANLADKIIIVQSGNSLSSILMENGANGKEISEIAAAMAPALSANALLEGQEIRLQFSRGVDDRNQSPGRVSFFGENGHIATVGRTNSGGFTLLEANNALVTAADGQVPATQERTSLYRSLYETGFQQSIPESIIDQVIRNHSYDVDFKRNAQAGDTLEVFYKMADEFDANGQPEILYSALTVRGETRRFYRFRTPDDGRVDFYDEEGNSAKKFLIRIPVNGAVLRSRFGMRRHPILGYRKMHTGIDLTAPRYTPIVAAGNGVVERAGWSSGYGRRTVIRHANGYKTTYSHQQGFAEGVEPGARVRQGQVIGYVGSSGLSTGPHLHYEVSVNGNYVNPMTIRVPRGRSLQGRNLAAFQRERERINRLMQQPPASTRIATADTTATN
jgi:murein DD-endopeptidase MepM/ murein hydrolase activator NlpD